MKLPLLFSNPKVALIFWISVALVGVAIYVGAAWMQQHG